MTDRYQRLRDALAAVPRHQEREMSSVFYDSPFNSTFFTTCCKAAITDDQQRCPRCKQDVYPFHRDMSDLDRWRTGAHHVNMARSSAAKRGAR